MQLSIFRSALNGMHVWLGVPGAPNMLLAKARENMNANSLVHCHGTVGHEYGVSKVASKRYQTISRFGVIVKACVTRAHTAQRDDKQKKMQQ